MTLIFAHSQITCYSYPHFLCPLISWKKEQKPLAEDEHVDSEKKSDMGKKSSMYVYMSWQVFQ